MTDTTDPKITKKITELYNYHDDCQHSIQAGGIFYNQTYNITKTGLSILDDVEAHLTTHGPTAEQFFIQALAVLAREIVGSHLSKAND